MEIPMNNSMEIPIKSSKGNSLEKLNRNFHSLINFMEILVKRLMEISMENFNRNNGQ